MTIGIYRLNFPNTTKCYIGQSLDIESRFHTHLNKMRKQESSIKLNAAFLEYGEPTLEVLSECTPEELDEFETETIEIFDAVNNGFNRCSTPGGKTSLVGEYHPMSTYTDTQIVEVLELLTQDDYIDISEIVDITKVSKSVILGISCLHQHKWLEKLYPEQYIKLKNLYLIGTRKKLTKRGIKVSEYTVVSPSGEKYLVSNTREFSQLHGLDCRGLSKVKTGNRLSYKGWKLSS